MSKQEQAKKIMERCLNELDAISTRNDAPINSYIAEITCAAHLTAWNHRSMKPPKSLFFYLCDGVLYLHPSDMVSFKTDLKRLEKANKATTGKERP